MKYPGVIGMFIFDNAPSPCKKPDDCLNPDEMNMVIHELEWLRAENHNRRE